MKKILCLLLTLIFVLSVMCGCQKSGIEKPYAEIKNDDDDIHIKFSDKEINKIISDIPCDKYETYPALHSAPLTAKLYKYGETISVDVNDQRLIGLINLYNNAVYHDQYSYTQGLLNIEYLEEKVFSEEFRLELTYTPYRDESVTTPRRNTQYDTIIVTNKCFVIIAHDLPGYENEKDQYPFRAVGHYPYHDDYSWLDLFGF